MQLAAPVPITDNASKDKSLVAAPQQLDPWKHAVRFMLQMASTFLVCPLVTNFKSYLVFWIRGENWLIIF